MHSLHCIRDGGSENRSGHSGRYDVFLNIFRLLLLQICPRHGGDGCFYAAVVFGTLGSSGALQPESVGDSLLEQFP